MADNGDNFYNFKLLDTQYLGGRRLVHLSFTPKRTGENTFVGDCWVNDTTYAIQKITMRPSKDVNVNFVTGLTLIQEFKLINDTMWFLYKDKFIVDLAPMGQNKLGAKDERRPLTVMSLSTAIQCWLSSIKVSLVKILCCSPTPPISPTRSGQKQVRAA